MVELFFRLFYKIFFLLFIFLYLILYLVLGYRIENGLLVRKDIVVQIISWTDSWKLKLDNENYTFVNSNKVQLYDFQQWCYYIMNNRFCLDKSRYYQLPIVEKITVQQINYLPNGFKSITNYFVDYSNNCIGSKCFSEDIINIFKANNLLFVQTEWSLYICSFDFQFCKRLMWNFYNKLVLWWDKNGIYYIDKNSIMYLLKLK